MDRPIPLILARSLFDGSVYDPMQGLIQQINQMLQEGFSPDTLPDDLYDLYLLDYLVAQVNNGGFSQFIHNSHGHLATNLTRALNAARMLEFPELEHLILACQDWVAANPGEAARQDGFDTRAEALDPMDKQLYAMVFSTAEVQAFLAGLPEDSAEWLRPKLLEPEADVLIAELIEMAGSAAAEGQSPEDVAALVQTRADARLEEVSRQRVHGNDLDVERHALGADVRQEVDAESRSVNRDNLETRLVRRLYVNRFADRDRYTIAAAAWIHNRPHLRVVANSEREKVVQELIDSHPDAGIEKRARQFDALRDAIPGDYAIAFARALPKPGLGIFGRRHTITGHYHGFEEIMQRPEAPPLAIETTAGRFFAVPDGGRMTVCKIVAQRSPAEAKKQLENILRNGGSAADHRALRAQGQPVPGRVVGSAPLDPAWRALALELGLAETLGLATDGTEMEPERLIFIGRGMPLLHDASARKSRWQFPFASPGPLDITLSPAGADVRNLGSGARTRIFPDQIAQYRKDHARPPKA